MPMSMVGSNMSQLAPAGQARLASRPLTAGLAALALVAPTKPAWLPSLGEMDGDGDMDESTMQ